MSARNHLRRCRFPAACNCLPNFLLCTSAIVFPLVLGIAQEQFVSAVVSDGIVRAAGGRLFVVQNQLLASSRELQKNLMLLQGITEGTTDAVFVEESQGGT